VGGGRVGVGIIGSVLMQAVSSSTVNKYSLSSFIFMRSVPFVLNNNKVRVDRKWAGVDSV